MLTTVGCSLLFDALSNDGGAQFQQAAEVAVTGVVVLAVDGEEVAVIWAEGMLRGEGQYAEGIAMGETVEAFGIARDGSSLSICPSADYYLRRG